MKGLVDIQGTQAFLGGVSRRYVEMLIRRGELPVVRLGRRVLIDSADLEAFVQSRKQSSEK